ncbi:MAG: 2TM domain-containing protein [Anaerolineales bacterium]|nr:2TM domain-containing protein [Anaerolineales bacterium]MBS3753781.1 2TM domain-containing protein [Anaerolineales bacterium]
MIRDKEHHSENQKKLIAKYGFYRHLVVYLGTSGILWYINYRTPGKSAWLIWPILVWAVILFIHYLWVHSPQSYLSHYPSPTHKYEHSKWD